MWVALRIFHNWDHTGVQTTQLQMLQEGISQHGFPLRHSQVNAAMFPKSFIDLKYRKWQKLGLFHQNADPSLESTTRSYNQELIGAISCSERKLHPPTFLKKTPSSALNWFNLIEFVYNFKTLEERYWRVELCNCEDHSKYDAMFITWLLSFKATLCRAVLARFEQIVSCKNRGR